MEAVQVKPFDAKQYITDLKGKEYLPVAARIAWFRAEHPTGTVDTDPLIIGNTAVIKARVILDGIVIASGMATVRKWERNGEDRSIEKAETAAIGRALGVAGYGTLQAGDDLDEGDHLADSPQPKADNITPIAQGHTTPFREAKTIETPLTGGKSSAAERANGKPAAPVGGSKAPIDVMSKLMGMAAVQGAWKNPTEAQNTINKMWGEKIIHADMSDKEIADAVVARLKSPSHGKRKDEPEGESA